MSDNEKLTKSELLEKLKQCAQSDDTEEAHSEADALIISYIDDEEIATAYTAVEKWYA